MQEDNRILFRSSLRNKKIDFYSIRAISFVKRSTIDKLHVNMLVVIRRYIRVRVFRVRNLCTSIAFRERDEKQ